MALSKFDGVLSEAAYMIHMHGFNEDEFGESDLGGWNGLIDVTATVLLNLDEIDLRDRFIAEYGEYRGGFLVWIHEDSQGSVFVVEYGHDGGILSGSDRVGRLFDEAREEQYPLTDDEEMDN